MVRRFYVDILAEYGHDITDQISFKIEFRNSSLPNFMQPILSFLKMLPVQP